MDDGIFEAVEQISARLTLHESLLRALYERRLSEMPFEQREAYMAAFMSDFRTRLRFAGADQATASRVQQHCVHFAEGFFASVASVLDDLP